MRATLMAIRPSLIGVTIGRVILAVLSVWIAIVAITNLIDAGCAIGLLPPKTPFASGNYHMIATQMGALSFPAWLVGVLFAGVIVLESSSTVLLVRSAFQRSAHFEDAAFACLIVLFGGFVIFDELSGAFAMEATHRDLVVFVSVLYLVVRTDR